MDITDRVGSAIEAATLAARMELHQRTPQKPGVTPPGADLLAEDLRPGAQVVLDALNASGQLLTTISLLLPPPPQGPSEVGDIPSDHPLA